jgi:hypothetical protein
MEKEEGEGRREEGGMRGMRGMAAERQGRKGRRRGRREQGGRRRRGGQGRREGEGGTQVSQLRIGYAIPIRGILDVQFFFGVLHEFP